MGASLLELNRKQGESIRRIAMLEKRLGEVQDVNRAQQTQLDNLLVGSASHAQYGRTNGLTFAIVAEAADEVSLDGADLPTMLSGSLFWGSVTGFTAHGSFDDVLIILAQGIFAAESATGGLAVFVKNITVGTDDVPLFYLFTNEMESSGSSAIRFAWTNGVLDSGSGKYPLRFQAAAGATEAYGGVFASRKSAPTGTEPVIIPLPVDSFVVVYRDYTDSNSYVILGEESVRFDPDIDHGAQLVGQPA